MPEYDVFWEGNIWVSASINSEPVVLDRISATHLPNHWLARLVTDLEGPLILVSTDASNPVVWHTPIYVSEPSVVASFVAVACALALISWGRKRVKRT